MVCLINENQLMSNNRQSMTAMLFGKLLSAKWNTVQPVNFADKYFAIFQFLPILRIKCLQLFTREHHCACAEPRFVQKIKFYTN